MTVKCPCCGGDMQSVPADALEHAPLSTSQREIVAMLAKRYPRGMSVDQIANRLYALAPNGGPDTAAKVVHVQLHRLRLALKPFGWTAGAMRRQANSIGLRPIVRG